MKNKKVLLGVLAVVVIVGAALLVGNGQFLQGKLDFKKLTNININQKPKINPNWYKDLKIPKIVSPVVSSVPTVIVSNVPSQGGVSKVPSVVATPVASGVPVPASMTAGVDVNQLPVMTKDVLIKAANDELKLNPARFTLTKVQKVNLLNAYKLKRGIR